MRQPDTYSHTSSSLSEESAARYSCPLLCRERDEACSAAARLLGFRTAADVTGPVEGTLHATIEGLHAPLHSFGRVPRRDLGHGGLNSGRGSGMAGARLRDAGAGELRRLRRVMPGRGVRGLPQRPEHVARRDVVMFLSAGVRLPAVAVANLALDPAEKTGSFCDSRREEHARQGTAADTPCASPPARARAGMVSVSPAALAMAHLHLPAGTG